MVSRRYTFPKGSRLGGRGTFKSIRDHGVRVARGPLTMWGIANDVGHPRLGISIGRPVGNAVRRNRIKRLLRESFRLAQHDLPNEAVDLIIAVRPHAPFDLPEYQHLTKHLMHSVRARLFREPTR